MTGQSFGYVRSNELLSREDSRLVVIDMQEKLVGHVFGHQQITHNCRRLAEAAAILDVPLLATEQYPRGLGGTIPELAELLPNRPEKLRFSAAEVLQDQLAAAGDLVQRDKIVVAGIESHVCVLQTCLDFLAMGLRVYVPGDAVGSRNPRDADIALQRLRDCGCCVTSTESVMFEWCEIAGTPEFKQVSRLVTQSS